jgi:hypothetical protein
MANREILINYKVQTKFNWILEVWTTWVDFTKISRKRRNTTIPPGPILASPNLWLGWQSISKVGDADAPWLSGGGGGSHFGERQCRKVGQWVKEDVGGEGNPFWDFGWGDAHQGKPSTVRQLGGRKLAVVGWWRGGEHRRVGRWVAWHPVSSRWGASRVGEPMGRTSHEEAFQRQGASSLFFSGLRPDGLLGLQRRRTYSRR